MTQHETSTERFDIVVVGGGIAGLVAGLTAAEGGARVAVVESHGLGGRAKTAERAGYHYNVGPHALYIDGHLRPFLATRGIAPLGASPGTKVRLLRDGQLWPLSFNAFDIARTKLLAPRSRMKILSLLGRLPRMDTEQFTGMTWQEWLGNEPDDAAGVMRMLARTATYVNAPATFDAAAALTQVKAALKGVLYLDGGWHTIVRSLSAALTGRGGTILTNRTVLSVEPTRGVVIETSSGTVEATAAILAGLGPEAVTRLTGAPVAGVDRIGGPVYATVLDLALDRVHDGVVFGIDQPLYLSPHAPVAKLAPDGCGLVSLLRYIPDGETGDPDTDRTQLRALASQAGIDESSIVHERFLHRLTVANGFPAAAGGGLAGRPGIGALGIDGVFVAGDWVGPSGQLSDASSASAEAAARAALSYVSSRPHVAA